MRRSLMAVAFFTLATGSATAPAVGLDPSFAAPALAPLAEPCTSARAVHDLRCPNFTGFAPQSDAAQIDRVDAAGEPTAADGEVQATSAGSARVHPPALDGPLGLKPGRDLERGIASWYGPGFHGRHTANGERFDMNELTAAHKTLPFGTRVVVHNPRTGKNVVVRINDRGPFAKNRIIDLSKAAAHALGLTSRGHEPVQLRAVAQRASDS